MPYAGKGNGGSGVAGRIVGRSPSDVDMTAVASFYEDFVTNQNHLFF